MISARQLILMFRPAGRAVFAKVTNAIKFFGSRGGSRSVGRWHRYYEYHAGIGPERVQEIGCAKQSARAAARILSNF